MRRFLLSWFAVILAVNVYAQEVNRTMQREQLVREVQADVRRLSGYVGYDELKPATISAIQKVERHRFVPAQYADEAYDNHPLPIGQGQTISQPLIVALMTDLLNVDNFSTVLELGTGSGYQAAVLGEMVADVYTVEIVPELAHQATERLARLGYNNVHVRHGDGTKGWPEAGPFDGIIVTAAGIEIPPELLAQLKPGGRMVMPVGAQNTGQQLKVITKGEGGIESRDVLPVRFVPITGPNVE